jgi:hypothetical protein
LESIRRIRSGSRVKCASGEVSEQEQNPRWIAPKCFTRNVQGDNLEALKALPPKSPAQWQDAVSAPFGLKLYRRQCLAVLRDYLAKAATSGDASTAFYKFARRPYQDAPALPGLPYICRRVPTAGGKTILAAHSIAVACDAFMKSETPCALWAVADDPRPDARDPSGPRASEPAGACGTICRECSGDDESALCKTRRL